eukprot:1185273-Prorocentrum_minimum.AAC.2
MQDRWVYSYDGPIRCRTCGYILMMDQSDAGRACRGTTSAHYAQAPWPSATQPANMMYEREAND